MPIGLRTCWYSLYHFQIPHYGAIDIVTKEEMRHIDCSRYQIRFGRNCFYTLMSEMINDQEQEYMVSNPRDIIIYGTSYTRLMNGQFCRDI